MRKFFMVGFLLALVFLPQAQAQVPTAANGMEGDWVGGTDAPGQWMSLQVSFTKSPAGYEGILDGFSEVTLGFDSLAIQKLKLRSISVSGEDVRFEIPIQGAAFLFKGTFNGRRLSGTVENGNRKATLHLMRVANLNPQLHGAYVGSYSSTNKRMGVTWREFGGLRLIDLKLGTAETLIPLSEDVFCLQKSILKSSQNPQTIKFIRDKHGKVTGYEMSATKTLATRTDSFRQEQVSFKNGATSLSGTLILPSGSGPHPAVVLVHGYGPIYRTALFERAATFTRMGVAALIYDKRGVGQSTGDWRMSAFDELSDDALAGVQLLRARKDITRNQIGLQGHSQAGDIIPIAASKSNSIAFMIIASGGGVKYEESVRYEKKNDLISAGRFSPQQIEDAVSLLQRVHDYVIRGIGDRNQLEADYLKAQTQPWFGVTDLPRFRTLPAPESRQLVFARKEIGFDPAPYVEKLKIPVLVLLGEQDRVVPTEHAAQRWRESLSSAGNVNFKIEIIPGADHGLGIKQQNGKRTIAPDYWGVMSTWLFIQLDGVRRA